MAVTEKALGEGPGSAGALVKPQYGTGKPQDDPVEMRIGEKCPVCGAATIKRMASGELACPACGAGAKKAVGFVVDTAATKEADWEMKEAQRDGVPGLYIKGYASTWMEDRDGDTVARDAFDRSLKTYLDDNPVLLLDHKRDQVLGEITKGWTDDAGLGIEAFIPKPEADEERWKITAYRDIKRGLRKALSMGGVFYRASQKGVSKVIERVDLFEISNVAVPSNPKSLFRVIGEKGLSFSDGKGYVPGPYQAEDDETVMCGNCGKMNDTDARFCDQCGDEIEGNPDAYREDPDEMIKCLKCSKMNDTDAHYCDQCGYDMVSDPDDLLGDDDDGKAAPADPPDGAVAVSHTHVKAGGGKMVHAHADPQKGHAHPTDGLLPMFGGKDSVEAAFKAAADFVAKAAGNEQALLDHWKEQMGGGDGEPGDFDACVSALSSHKDIDDPEALCAWIHMQVTGHPPGHAPGDKTYPVTDEKGATGTPRLHVHVPVGGKGPGKFGMVHSHPLDGEAGGHRHEGYRPFQHPTTSGGEIQKMATETGTKNEKAEGAGGDATQTVTLSAEEFKSFQQMAEEYKTSKRQREIEETAEAVAERKLAEQKAADEAKEAEQRGFVNEVAQRAAEIMAAKQGSIRSERKFAWGNTERSLGVAGVDRGTKSESMIDLLYRKAQGDPEARQSLRDMSQKAAVEMGVKALAEGGSSGYLVPPQYMQQGIAEYRIAAAKVRQLCTVIGGVNSNLVYIPRETGIATVGWTAEGAPKPSTDQTFGQLAVNIFTLAGISKVNNQLLEDSSPAVDQLVRKDLGRLLGQAEDIAFLTGTGAGQPTGILNTAGILTGAIGGATIADAIASGIAAIQANYYGDPEAIVMNPKHLNTLRTAKDANNRYIFEPAFFPMNSPMMRAFMENNGPGGANGTLGGGYNNFPSQGGPQGTVWGLPVYADANLPAPTNAGNIIVGAFSEAYILERTGVTIDVSSEAGTSFEQNQTWFRGEERLGFTAARQPTAFYTITGLP